MKKKYGVELKKYTTFKMGGIAEVFWTPECENELIALLNEIEEPRYLIGGGSNLLINDEKHFSNVINLREFNRFIEKKGNGVYRVGASVRLQKLINEINQDGYGGIEYLYSVPGLVGGAVYMNAGRGEKHGKSICDYIREVEVYHQGEKKILKKEECSFSYRKSVFQDDDYFILAVILEFPKMKQEDTKVLKQQRMELCKEKQDNSAPNYGTVFCVADRHIMQLVKSTGLRKKGRVMYSSKTGNWMLNPADGKFKDAVALIKRVEKIHSALRKDYRVEVKIWE